jgi:hypothetical protein
MTDKSFPDEPEKTTAEREAEARARPRGNGISGAGAENAARSAGSDPFP